MKEMEMTRELLPLDQPEDGSGSVTITCDVPDPAMNCHYAHSNGAKDCSAKEKVLGATAYSSEAHSPSCGEDRGNTSKCNSPSSSSLKSDEPCDSSNVSKIISNSDEEANDICNSIATHEKCFATKSDPLCGNGESSFLKEEKINALDLSGLSSAQNSYVVSSKTPCDEKATTLELIFLKPTPITGLSNRKRKSNLPTELFILQDDKLSDKDCNPRIIFTHVKEEKQNVLLNKTSTNNCSTDDVLENNISSRMENVSFSSPVIVSSLTKKVTATEHANNVNIPVHSAFSTFQTISFQPHTTPSINFPIFSCKSSTDGQYSDQDNTASSILNGSIGCTSRRTKSSDALFDKISSSSLSENQNNFDISRKSERLGGKRTDNIQTTFQNYNYCGIGLYSKRNYLTSDCTSCGSFGSGNPFETKYNIQFSMRPPLQSIGLFQSYLQLPTPQRPVNSHGNTVFPSSASISSDKKEQIFGVKYLNTENNFKHTVQNSSQKELSEIIFNFNSNINTSEKRVYSFSAQSNETNEKSTSFLKSESTPPLKKNSSDFNSRLLPGSRRGEKRERRHLKPVRRDTKIIKENMSSTNSSLKEICAVPFKPCYGSDSKIEQGINKNVIVRYQHISMMKPYLSISPEELRCEYQLRCESSNGFKLNALVNEKFGAKEKQDEVVQTEKDTSEIGPNLKEIWRALECPVCLDVVLPPVHQCEQGHHVCSSCWLKVNSCPLCKRRKSTSRNYVAETLVEQIPLPCKYRIEGCKETVQHESKRTHESGCLYRMYQCPVLGCTQSHSYPNMGKHFTTFHKSLVHNEGHSVGKGEKFCDILYKESLEHGLIHVFDITKWGLFFLRNDRPAVGRSTTLFVQILPASADKAAYFYQLEVSDHRDCRKESYKGQVFPLGKPTHEIIKEEEYLDLSQLILKTVKKTTPLKIVVTIWQLKAAFTFSTK